MASETISKRTAFWKPALLRANTCWGGSWTTQLSRTAFLHLRVPDSFSELLQASQTFQIMATFLFWHTILVFSFLLCSQRILQLVCNSYLISSSIPIKEFHLFSLSGRLRRELITVHRHLHSQSVWSILTLQTDLQRPWHLEINHTECSGWFLTILANIVDNYIIQSQHKNRSCYNVL